MLCFWLTRLILVYTCVRTYLPVVLLIEIGTEVSATVFGIWI